MAINAIIQNINGIADRIVHTVGGYEATYTLVTDQTTDPLTVTTLTVFLGTTPTGWVFDDSTGRRVRQTEDIFFISREFLKVSGTFREPTLFDSFVQFGTTTPIYHVTNVEDLAEAAGTFQLTVHAVETEHARG